MKLSASRMVNVAAGLALVAGLAGAQTTVPCDPTVLKPNGLTLRDLSRDVFGGAFSDPNTMVYFSICPATNTITRTTLGQPFRMALNRQGCDEVPEFNASLVGRYYSVRRMNDPFPNYATGTDPNPRIGYEYVAGNVVSVTGAVLGTFEMNGTIATNTSRPLTPDGVGSCYECAHHQGYVTIKFTVTPYSSCAVFAEYHYHTLPDDPIYCDQQDPCQIDFQLAGVLDGIYLCRCPQTTATHAVSPRTPK